MSKFFDWFNKDKKSKSQPEQVEPLATEEPSAKDVASAKDVPSTEEEPLAKQETLASEEPSAVENTSAIEKTSAIDQISANEGHSSLEPAPAEPPKVSAEQAQGDAPSTIVGETVESQATKDSAAEAAVAPAGTPEPSAAPEPTKKPKFFERLKAGLSRTKQNIGTGFVALFKGKTIDDELYEDLETQLLVADVGMDTTTKIIDALTEKAKLSQLKDGEALYGMLKAHLQALLAEVDKPLVIENPDGPFVILMVGVNGVGKTTTIGKLAKQYQQQGKKVMLAAGDTFRAAAVEQLAVWGERNEIPVVAQHTGADSASVLFDALNSAKAKGVDVLIADTAGRLQNKDNLMEELKKVVRVMKKVDPNAPHEIMLTLDAATGQNAVSQAKLFNQAVGLTGITLTKLDGTAKGGVIFAVADQLNIPIRYIGVGEGIDDLRDFDSQEFIDALFSDNQES